MEPDLAPGPAAWQVLSGANMSVHTDNLEHPHIRTVQCLWQSPMQSTPEWVQVLGPGKYWQRLLLSQGSWGPWWLGWSGRAERGTWVGLEHQGRAWYLRSGACSLVGSPVGGFTQQVQQGATTELGGGKASTSPVLAEEGNQLVPHQFNGQRDMASVVSEAIQLLWPCSAKSCCLLVQIPLLGSLASSLLQPHYALNSSILLLFTITFFQALSLCFLSLATAL